MIQLVNPENTEGHPSREIPLCEVKMKERDWAIKVRREFGKLKRLGKIEGNLHVVNNMTLATRVRLEILKGITKKCSGARK